MSDAWGVQRQPGRAAWVGPPPVKPPLSLRNGFAGFCSLRCLKHLAQNEFPLPALQTAKNSCNPGKLTVSWPMLLDTPLASPASCDHALLDSPIGKLLLTGTRQGISGLWIWGEKHCPAPFPAGEENPTAFTEAARQLAEYFAGTRTDFNLPLVLAGTPFQQAAWAALRQIPYGQTRSYQQQAAAIQRPAAIRAIGTANGKNPISIIVPCHRVIGANGSLTGYGGGLAAKQWLLAHEARHSLLGKSF